MAVTAQGLLKEMCLILRRWTLPPKINYVKGKPVFLDECVVGRRQEGGHAILTGLSLLPLATPPSEAGKGLYRWKEFTGAARQTLPLPTLTFMRQKEENLENP
ncbi:uncharacterized protein LOC144228447 [Crocuta crocuta]